MMRLPRKCEYALRAVFELAMRDNSHPIKIHQIAGAQNIPPRFLEVILNELRHAGLVESRRGKAGGYMLARAAEDLTVAEVVEHIQGSTSFVPDATRSATDTALSGSEAFKEFWREVNDAVSNVCATRTFAELVQFERAKRDRRVPNYSI